MRPEMKREDVCNAKNPVILYKALEKSKALYKITGLKIRYHHLCIRVNLASMHISPI